MAKLTRAERQKMHEHNLSPMGKILPYYEFKTIDTTNLKGIQMAERLQANPQGWVLITSNILSCRYKRLI